MCRSIKTLRRPGEPATPDEVSAAALQFVRKISGFHKPSRANQEAFERAILEISGTSERLLLAIGVPSKRAEPIETEARQ
jgi:hypothetical protein